MHQRTEGIILHTTHYSENSLIVKIYTSDFGLQSFITNTTRNKKSKYKSALLQPLSIVELVIPSFGYSKLNRITEINLLYPYTTIPFDIIKSSIAIFLNEILYKALKEEHSDIHLFEFIRNALQLLDLKEGSCSFFHIYFMYRLCTYLGFAPQGVCNDKTPVFDLKEGQFVPFNTIHTYLLSPECSAVLYQLQKISFEQMDELAIPKSVRKKMIYALINYYQLHIPSFGELKSIAVIEEIMA